MFHNAFTSFRCHPKAVHACLFRTSISRKRCTASLGPKSSSSNNRANFDLGSCSLAHGIRETLGPLERLLPRFHLDEGVASDELFGLGEWPIDHGRFSPEYLIRQPSKLVAVRRHQATLFRQFLLVCRHGGKELLLRFLARLRVFRGLDRNHESHWLCLVLGIRRTRERKIDRGLGFFLFSCCPQNASHGSGNIMEGTPRTRL